MNVAMDLTSSTISPINNQTQATPPPPPPSTSAASETSFSPPAIEPRSGSLPDTAKEWIRAGARELENSGASAEEVQAFMVNEMEANGADISDSGQRSGQWIDIMA